MNTAFALALLVACGGKSTGDTGEDPPPSTPVEVDADADGYPEDTDCDDADASVNPGAAEVPYDGVDNDCDGATPDDDLDADGFVIAEDCDDQDAAIHPDAAEVPGDGIDNDCDASTCVASGFATTAIPWALPDFTGPAGPTMAGFFTAAPLCGDNQPEYELIDLDGDLRDDVVVVEPPCSDGVVGYSAWHAYGSSAAGFDTAPASWTLPAYPATGSLAPLGELVDLRSGDCLNGRPSYELLAMDDDERLDLVVTDPPCDDGVIGYTSWSVYLGVAGGFSTTAISWQLPPFAAPPGSPLMDATFSVSPSCTLIRPAYRTLDLDGDGWQDFVVTELPCDDGVVGHTAWHVYLGSSTGFAQTPTVWSLPNYPQLGGTFPVFERMEEIGPDCGRGKPAFLIREMTGDTRPDLLVTQEPCDDGVTGWDSWKIYPGLATGFSPIATLWTLPPVPAATEAPWPGRSTSFPECDAGVSEYELHDLDGDGWQDLVVVEAACDDGQTGSARWLVHLGSAAGASPTPTEWTLPSLPAGPTVPPLGAFDDIGRPNCYAGIPTYAVRPMNGDRAGDLVVTMSACDDGVVGTTQWHVYPAECAL